MREREEGLREKEVSKRELDEEGEDMYADMGTVRDGFGREKKVKGGEVELKIGAKELFAEMRSERRMCFPSWTKPGLRVGEKR